MPNDKDKTGDNENKLTNKMVLLLIIITIIMRLIQARSQDLKSGGAISITGGAWYLFIHLFIYLFFFFTFHSTNCIFKKYRSDRSLPYKSLKTISHDKKKKKK